MTMRGRKNKQFRRGRVEPGGTEEISYSGLIRSIISTPEPPSQTVQQGGTETLTLTTEVPPNTELQLQLLPSAYFSLASAPRVIRNGYYDQAIRPANFAFQPHNSFRDNYYDYGIRP